MARQKKNVVETNGSADEARIKPGDLSSAMTPGPVQISAPNMCDLHFTITGNAPYVQCRFPEKARNTMQEKMALGSQAKKGALRKARDFDEDYEGAFHMGPKGEYGIPASAFRNAAIRACSIVNFKMTLAKMSIFVVHDFVDPRDGTMLVAIRGTPEKVIHPVRNATGVADLRVRAMWKEWSADLHVTFDGDQFNAKDVLNLFSRVGAQVGIGEGRAMSKESAGMGWGSFVISSVHSILA